MFKKILITGGPCGGKTTFIRESTATLDPLGIKVLTSQEAATLIINSGADSRLLGFQEKVYWHYSVIKLQMGIEDNLFFLSNNVKWNYKHTLLLCDRGSLDSKAFCTSSEWRAVLNLGGWKEIDFYNRYDSVIFMETIARLDAAFYLSKINSIRIEDPDQAVKSDEFLYREWSSHPKFSFVKSNISFSQKLKEVTTLVYQNFE